MSLSYKSGLYVPLEIVLELKISSKTAASNEFSRSNYDRYSILRNTRNRLGPLITINVLGFIPTGRLLVQYNDQSRF